MAKGYLIGDAFKDKIKSTIARVDGWIDGSETTKIETRFESMPMQQSKVFRICTFTGAWAKTSDKTVTFRGVTSTPNTVSATNLFAAITAPESSGNCAIARDGTAWYLIAAECD
jgi:hypothetical protein